MESSKRQTRDEALAAWRADPNDQRTWGQVVSDWEKDTAHNVGQQRETLEGQLTTESQRIPPRRDEAMGFMAGWKHLLDAQDRFKHRANRWFGRQAGSAFVWIGALGMIYHICRLAPEDSIRQVQQSVGILNCWASIGVGIVLLKVAE